MSQSFRNTIKVALCHHNFHLLQFLEAERRYFTEFTTEAPYEETSQLMLLLYRTAEGVDFTEWRIC